MRLLVIDGNSIANRAFYGIKLLTTKDGRYTNAIFGFLNIMNSLLRECEPDEVAVAFDLKHPTFRHEMYDGYKGTRHAMPDELAQQMPILKELLTDLGYRQVSAKGWEADDILGTLAAACEARRDDCFLATGDRDSLQLVSESTTVLLAATAMERMGAYGQPYRVVVAGFPFETIKGEKERNALMNEILKFLTGKKP